MRMNKLDKRLKELLPGNEKDLNLINKVYCFLMSKEEKQKVLDYLNLFKTAGLTINDEELAEYIELLIATN